MRHMKFYSLRKQTENQSKSKCRFPCWVHKMLEENVQERKSNFPIMYKRVIKKGQWIKLQEQKIV